MDNSELSLIEDGLGRVIADGAEGLGARLEQFGWFSLYDDEPGTAVRLLFGQNGIRASNSPILTLVMSLVVGEPVLTMVCGAVGTALVLPALGTSTPPARVVAGTDNTVEVDGVVMGAAIDRLVVIADMGGRHVFGELRSPAALVQALGGLDPDLGLRRVAGRAQFSPRPLNTATDALTAWQNAVAAGRLGLASELSGIGDRVLRRAVDYVTARHQFGRALGSFQAVQHQLAEVEVELAVARSAVLEAADHGGPITAALAKLLAGRAATRATGRAQQVFGGIGFTWEHGLHRDVRRVIALDSLLSTSAGLECEIGGQLCGSGIVPRLAPL